MLCIFWLSPVLRYQNNNLLGIGFMLLAMLLFETMDALVKWLVMADQSVTLILFFRSWLIVLMILVFLALRGELGELRTRKPMQHALRGLIGFFAPFCFFLASPTHKRSAAPSPMKRARCCPA